MITTDVRRHDLVGNGTVGPFTYQFLIRDKTHLQVYVDGNLQTVDTHYTVGQVGNESGGTVTFAVGSEPASNAEIILLAAEPCTQTTDYINAGNFPAASHEEALDKLTRLVAQLKEQITRTPVMAPPDHYNSADLTLAPASPGEFLRWDSLGIMLEPATPVTVPEGLPVGGDYDHLTINGSSTVEWAQQIYNFAENVVNVSKYATFAAAVTAIGSAVTTLVVSTSQTVAGNVTVPSTLRVIFEGQGALNIANGIVVTFDNPAQFRASARRPVFTGLGTVVLTKPGTVSPGWWGAVADNSTDDGPSLVAMMAALPAGSAIEFFPGTYKSNRELAVTVADLTVHMERATLNIININGTGTAAVHDTVNVLCGFKVTGDRFTLYGGRITGQASSNSKNVVGVLSHNADFTRIYNTKMDTLYCGFWAGGGATDYTLTNVEASTCSRNILLGFMPTTAANPNVTRATLINVNSHDATGGDGVKLHTHARDVEIIGGHFYDNSNNGIDLYVCGESVTVLGAIAKGNGVDGIAVKYALSTGVGANQLGFSRRTSLRGSILRNNGSYGIRAEVDDAYTGAELGVENVMIEGNLCEGNNAGMNLNLANSVVSGNICRANTVRGANFQSCQDTSVIGNQFWDNGTSDASGCVFGVAAYTGAANSFRCLVMGNAAGETRTGGSRTQSRGFVFSSMEHCVVMGNSGTNHSVADFLVGMSQTLSNRSFMNAGTLEAGSTLFGVYGQPVVLTANLPVAAAAQNGLILIEDAGAGNRNLIVYAGGERFRIDGGANV